MASPVSGLNRRGNSGESSRSISSAVSLGPFSIAPALPSRLRIGYNDLPISQRLRLMNAQTSTARADAAPAAPVLLREDMGEVAVLTLNRPQARNSLSEALIAAL